MRWAGDLRRELSTRNQQIAVMNGSLHELTAGEMPSVIFGCSEDRQHGNFYPASWRNMCANPEWARRLAKVHTGSRSARPRAGWRWRELDCAKQLRRFAHEYLLLPPPAQEPCLEFHAGSAFRTGAAVRIQAGNSPPQRQDGPHRDRHETRRPHGGGQASRRRIFERRPQE